MEGGDLFFLSSEHKVLFFPSKLLGVVIISILLCLYIHIWCIDVFYKSAKKDKWRIEGSQKQEWGTAFPGAFNILKDGVGCCTLKLELYIFTEKPHYSSSDLQLGLLDTCSIHRSTQGLHFIIHLQNSAPSALCLFRVRRALLFEACQKMRNISVKEVLWRQTHG